MLSIELVTTKGTFKLDGGEWEVTNNIWLVGNESELVVIDAAHDHLRIVEALHGRKLRAILLTHGQNDHINAAIPLRDMTDAPIFLHPSDQMLWDVVWPDHTPDMHSLPNDQIDVGGHRLAMIHTPGHSPGCCCFVESDSEVVFSGDTLFCGGPGATGRSYSDEATIIQSIFSKLLVLPDSTIVHTGHGNSTTIGQERELILEKVREMQLNRLSGERKPS